VKFLVVPIDRFAQPFCYYRGADSDASEPIPLEVLAQAVHFAVARDLTVNFVYGRREPPKAFVPLMGSVRHADIVPLSLAESHPGSVVVVGPDELEHASKANLGKQANVIVRFPVERVAQLCDCLPPLLGRHTRLSLCLLNLEKASDSDLELYELALKQLVGLEAEWLRSRTVVELGFLTDRLLLTSMRNCQAGIDHVTVGPEGDLFLCPGFLADQPETPIGSLARGLQIPNAELLSIDHSPICSSCDAYQCKRCIYLNKTLTLEMNTPSHQQCVSSHHERNASRSLLTLLRDVPPFSGLPSIPELDYLDPFKKLRRTDVVTNPDVSTRSQDSRTDRTRPEIGTRANGSLEQLLMRILKTQEEILELLKGGARDE
jgi:CXXX repeat peptide maturase